MPAVEYNIATGALMLGGAIIAHGYSGAGSSKNNPDAVKYPAAGPIPPGDYKLTGVRDSVNTGPYTILLEPCPGTDTFGRSLFRIHGDSIANPGTASHGCIILPRTIRQRIWTSGARVITVKGT